MSHGAKKNGIDGIHGALVIEGIKVKELRSSGALKLLFHSLARLIFFIVMTLRTLMEGLKSAI